ncbi:hypothetical protein AVEN_137672-1 [Araneus ventricosus]|uniref:Uncharacterized protein n=1 Tax=Araneus ventricosus TaxID=182803 RepID=A0A4Y2Q7E3_ARAVE|nr:hypothetical protein AVEN_137672-1 [Araneus ventricosus]
MIATRTTQRVSEMLENNLGKFMKPLRFAAQLRVGTSLSCIELLKRTVRMARVRLLELEIAGSLFQLQYGFATEGQRQYRCQVVMETKP